MSTNIFAGKTSVEQDKVEEDYLAGGGALDTDIYTAKIKTLYLQKASKSEAQSANFLLEINGREVRNQIWISNRNGDVTYKDKKTGKDKNLPGFSQINALCMIVAGKELQHMDVEERVVRIYDFDARKEIPQPVDCFVELHDETIQIALQKQTVDKTKIDDASGKYLPTGETRDVNEIVKFFPSDKLVTISEISQFVNDLGGNLDDILANGEMPQAISNIPEDFGSYAEKWVERNKGQTYDKSSGKSEGKALAKAGTAKGGESEKKKATSLFDN